MRAVFLELENIQTDEVVSITGDSAHHLLKVVRLKLDEELLLMNGKGLLAKAQVVALNKRDLAVKIIEAKLHPKHELIKLAIAVPSKEAMEEVLRQSVELGITHIQPLLTQYSEKNFEPAERHQRILESALIQSNNPYFPEIAPATRFDAFLESMSKQDTYLYFSSRPRENKAQAFGSAYTLIIGPEGGFSESEESSLDSRANVKFIHLPSYILRTPTAVCTAAGLAFASHLNQVQ